MAKHSVKPIFPVNRITDPSPEFVKALREDSNYVNDWLFWASQMTARAEQLYCLERAHYINPTNPEAAEGIARLRSADQRAAPVEVPNIRQRWIFFSKREA